MFERTGAAALDIDLVDVGVGRLVGGLAGVGVAHGGSDEREVVRVGGCGVADGGGRSSLVLAELNDWLEQQGRRRSCEPLSEPIYFVQDALL